MQSFEQLQNIPTAGGSLPELFDLNVFDIPHLDFGLPGDYAFLDDSTEAGSVIEEVLDFFVDPTDPARVVLARSPMSNSSFSPPASAPASSCVRPQHCQQPVRPKVVTAAPMVYKSSVAVAKLGSGEKQLAKRERNRQAAERCRARKMGLIQGLQSEVDSLQAERDQLRQQNRQLLELLAMAGVIAPK
jgi:hypothetical protein